MERFFSFRLRSLCFKLLVLSFAILMFNSQDVSAQYKRNVVFEIFSEVWCGPCAYYTPIHKVWLSNHPDYIPIYFYSYFMVNNVKDMNTPTDYNARHQFYSVPFYPYARINAVMPPYPGYLGFPADTNAMNALIDTLTKTTPVKVEIDFTNNGGSGNVKINLTSDIALIDKYIFVFLVEKEHIYTKQQNGMTDFHYVMRKTLPQSTGEKFSIKAGETLSFDYNYTLDAKINTDLYATVIVQDNQSKYIYQAESVFKSFSVSVDDRSENSDKLQVFPNPVKDNFTIQLNSEDENIQQIQILDLIGNQIFELNPANKSNHLTISDNSIPLGVYFLKVVSNKNIYYQKIIVNP